MSFCLLASCDLIGGNTTTSTRQTLVGQEAPLYSVQKNPCFTFPVDSADYLPLVPHSWWAYWYSEDYRFETLTETWRGGVKLEITDAICAKDSALYAIRQTYSVIHRQVFSDYIGGIDVESDTARGDTVRYMTEHPDGTLSGGSFAYLQLDLDRRYRTPSPDSLLTMEVPVENQRDRRQKYKSGVGLILSEILPPPFNGVSAYSSLRLKAYSIPDTQ